MYCMSVRVIYEFVLSTVLLNDWAVTDVSKL